MLATLRRELRRGYIDPARAERSIDLYLRPFQDAAGRVAILAHIQALEHAQAISIAQRLSTVAVPTSLIWGRRDRLVPLLLGQRLQAAIPGATLDVIPDVGHFTPEEAPQRISESIAVLLKR